MIYSLFFVGFRENRPFEVNIDFLHNFGANLAPFSFPKSINIQKKSFLKCIYFLIDFCIDVFSIWAQFWEPTWRHVGPMLATISLLRAAQTPPKTRLEARIRPDPLQTSICIYFWSIFDRFSNDFRSIFRCFLVRFFRWLFQRKRGGGHAACCALDNYIGINIYI